MFLVLAHRGASASCRENTIAAFARAVEAGADGVELDVRHSADGALVVHHDPVIEGAGLIRDLRVADLPDWVPLLDEAVAACQDLLVNIELKNHETEPDFDPDEHLAVAVARFVAGAGIGDRVVVSSFNLAAVDRVRSVEPDLRTGYLMPPVGDQYAALAAVHERGHAALHPHHLAVNAELCAAAHAQGTEVITWTVDDPERMSWLADCGVDALITNVPDVGARLRDARG